MNFLDKVCAAIVLALVFPGVTLANNGSVALAWPVENIVIDGDLSEWSDDLPRYPIGLNIFGDPLDGEDDFRGSYRVGYDEKNLRVYAAFEIHDESFVIDGQSDDNFDSLTVSLSAEHGAEGAIGQRVWHRGEAAVKEYPHSKFGMQTSGSKRTYEVSIDLTKFGINEKPVGPFTCSWTVEVNDADKDGSASYVCWSSAPWKMFDKNRQGDLVVIPPNTATQTIQGQPTPGTESLSGFSLIRYQSVEDPNLSVAIRTDKTGAFELTLPKGEYRRTVTPRVKGKPTIVVSEEPFIDTIDYGLTVTKRKRLRVHREWKQGSGRFVPPKFKGEQFEPRRMVREFDATDRLPATTIYDLAQSADSTMWAATETGVFSFDGVRVRHYKLARGSDVYDIEIVHKNDREEIWVGTLRGLFIIDRRNNTYRKVGRLGSRIVECIEKSHEGKMLVATTDGLFQEDDDGFRAYAPPQGGVTSHIRSLAAGRDCTWVGSDGGLFRFDDGKFELQAVAGINSHRVSALHVDSNESLWIGTSSSLLRYANGEFRDIRTQNKERYRYVRDIVEDHDEELWVATWDGTIHIPRDEKLAGAPRFQYEPSTALTDLTIDHENNRWISFEESASTRLTCVNANVEQYTSNPCFLVCVSERHTSFASRHDENWYVARHPRDADPAESPQHWRVDAKPTKLIDDGETFLVGTENGLLELHDGQLEPHRIEALQSGKVQDLLVDRQNVLWIATPKSLFRVDGDELTDMQSILQLPDERPSTIMENLKGEMSISTHYGLSIVRDNQLLDLLSHDNGLRSNLVFKQMWARDGALWIAMVEGLQRYHHGEFTSYLPAGSAKKRQFGKFITECSDGQIWVGSESGITVVEPSPNLVQLIHSSDYFGAAAISHAVADGEHIWVASSDGLFRYRKSKHKPSIVIDQITTDRQLDNISKVELTTDEPLLAFDFHAISPTHRNGSALYRYRLKGHDEDWVDTYATKVEFSDLPHGDYEFELQAFNQDLKSSDLVTIPITVALPYGRYATILTMSVSLLGLVGIVVWTLLKQSKEKEILATRVQEEVEEKLLLAEQLRNVQKLESLGTLAAGVAHDFNNSLQATLMNAELGLCENTSIDKIHDYLRDISDTSKQASELTKSLLLFGGRASGIRKPTNLNKLVASCAKMIRRTIPSSIEVLVDAPDEQLWANVDESQIHQALVNLCVNARDAMPNGGVLRLTTAAMTTAAGIKSIRIRVIDNGEGIPADVADQVFDPFFTSKPREKGTGLGLSIVHGVVASHNGTVTLHSTAGSGTEFEITLPGCAPPATTHQDLPESKRKSGQGFILIADDQAIVRQTLRQGLEMFHYRIEDAEDGIVAMELFTRFEKQLDAAVLDIDMPGLDGVTVMNRIRETGWSKPIVLITGYPTNSPEMDEHSCLIRKPFTLPQIIAAVSPSDTNSKNTKRRIAT